LTKKKKTGVGCGGFYKPIIPATEEAKIRRIVLWGQSGQKVSKTPSQQISWAW
jgi:hypothetical protein